MDSLGGDRISIAFTICLPHLAIVSGPFGCHLAEVLPSTIVNSSNSIRILSDGCPFDFPGNVSGGLVDQSNYGLYLLGSWRSK